MNQLKSILNRIDGKGYRAYKDIAGSYNFPSISLHIDHVQGDPFAAPSKIRIRVPAHGFPEELFRDRVRRTALEDYLTRRID